MQNKKNPPFQSEESRSGSSAGPWNGRVVPPLFPAPLRLREVIVHGQVCLLEKDKRVQVRRAEGEKRGLLGTPSSVFYPAALREEVVGGCS